MCLVSKVSGFGQVVTREAIYDGSGDCSFIYSLVNWVLPYAQRYVYNRHPDKYFQLKQSGFQNLKNLKIAVVQKLFYRNVIKKHEIMSKKKHECNCLLQVPNLNNVLFLMRSL